MFFSELLREISGVAFILTVPYTFTTAGRAAIDASAIVAASLISLYLFICAHWYHSVNPSLGFYNYDINERITLVGHFLSYQLSAKKSRKLTPKKSANS